MLKLQEEDCSAFGRLVLQYLKDNPQMTMSQLARQVKLSHAGLSWICLKRSNPDEETAERVAQVIGADLSKISRLVHENKLERLASLKNLNYVAELDGNTLTNVIPIEDAIAGLNAVFHAFHYVIRSVPETRKPTDFQIYKESYEIVKKQFLKNGKPFKK
ncbi:helix-turn-helix transcriptional regulator [Leptolyngbya sp. FACHB-36]|uniref:helix-turn-helix domain-containing protein n=1 Tax=Leptolyngbya sp. FACHB-36 TaxID=2692808 RepID=UPI00168065B7|nr:helix-turn-helix transcriptional regulator [Leptolyngbya sp. FACHB-36]MBD2021335.1 helix-turn-helix transcriptional regulator [Leptolyngbya sp. FACHB-36]